MALRTASTASPEAIQDLATDNLLSAVRIKELESELAEIKSELSKKCKQNETLKAALNDIEIRLLAMSIERGEGNMKRLVLMAHETVEKTLAEVAKLEAK